MAAAGIDALMGNVLGEDGDEANAPWLTRGVWAVGIRPWRPRRTHSPTTGWRVLILIDGLGAQKVIRAASTDEITHIARSYLWSELGSDRGATSPR